MMSDLIIFIDGTPRPLNAVELAHHEATVQKAEAEAEAQTAKAEAKAAKVEAKASALAKLGLTADEVAALFG